MPKKPKDDVVKPKRETNNEQNAVEEQMRISKEKYGWTERKKEPN